MDAEASIGIGHDRYCIVDGEMMFLAIRGRLHSLLGTWWQRKARSWLAGRSIPVDAGQPQAGLQAQIRAMRSVAVDGARMD